MHISREGVKGPNRAERAVRTAKNHIIATRAGFHPDCSHGTYLFRQTRMYLKQMDIALNIIHPLYNVWIPNNAASRVSNTVWWFMTPIKPNPFPCPFPFFPHIYFLPEFKTRKIEHTKDERSNTKDRPSGALSFSPLGLGDFQNKAQKPQDMFGWWIN
jgi:hypothetical protein